MRVLVTGAGSGIGRATAEVLATRGHEVVATARRPEVLAELDVAARLALDVTSAAGDLDAIVNNAGITETGPLETYPHEALLRMFETNTFGPMRLVRAVVPTMRERGAGVIVNVTSVEGRVAAP
ncbi:MAG TPA: SDR family NAD(P)-dependent oxidoreductase, partial [Aquihabitans sp.]|nr:SDR family NAD(P)-dependent oxidoreductase [Aquihabitans sp.]